MTIDDLKLLGHIYATLQTEDFNRKINKVLPKMHKLIVELPANKPVWIDIKTMKDQFDVKSNFGWLSRQFNPELVKDTIYRYYRKQWHQDYKSTFINAEFNDVSVNYKRGSDTFSGELGYTEYDEWVVKIVKYNEWFVMNRQQTTITVMETTIPFNIVKSNRLKLQERKAAMISDNLNTLTLADFFPNIDSKTINPEADTFIDQLILIEQQAKSDLNPSTQDSCSK